MYKEEVCYMTEINRDFRRVDYSNNNSSSQVKTEKKDIKLEDISVLYSTEKLEEDRTSFEETFEKKSLDEASDGKKFLNSLIENKDEVNAFWVDKDSVPLEEMREADQNFMPDLLAGKYINRRYHYDENFKLKTVEEL